MRLGRRLRVLFGILMTFQVVTALAGIGLLERMTPALSDVLEDNVATVRAVESMLAALADAAPDSNDRRDFMDALSVAERNVTEAEERPVLRRIRGAAAQALEGDPGARAEAIDSLTTLGRINREAMVRSDREARRLGSAGRWALAFLAVAGLVASVVAVRRSRRALLAPLVELHAVTSAYRAGDPHRRCRTFQNTELSQVLTAVNQLLDGREQAAEQASTKPSRLQMAIASLLDAGDEASILLDDDDGVLAASENALERMTKRGDAILAAVRAGDADEDVREVVRLTPSNMRLVKLRPGV